MKLGRKILLVLALLLLALAVWVVTKPHVGKTALEDYRKQLAARGEKMSVEQLAPQFTAEELDAGRDLMDAVSRLVGGYRFAAPAMVMIAPGRAAITWNQEVWPSADFSNDWPNVRKEVLFHSNALENLRAALKQPLGGLKLDYAQGWSLPLPHLGQLKGAAIGLLYASRLELHDGKVDESLEDLKACIVFTHFSEREPIIISQLVRVAIINMAFQNTWEILQYPGLNDRQLAELQRAWESAGVITNMPAIFEMERVMNAIAFEKARRGEMDARAVLSPGPRTASPTSLPAKVEEWVEEFRYKMWKKRWSYDEELCISQTLQAGMDALRDMQSNAPFAGRVKKASSEYDAIFNSFTNVNTKFVMGPGGIYGCLRKFAITDTARELILTAIALKRYQIAHQHYPARLDELVPDFLRAIPLDPMDRKPLRYHPNPDGTFLLYSIGEDGVDDGGDPMPPKTASTSHIYWTAGRDIVWPVPATPDETAAFKKKAMDDWVSKHPVEKTNQPGK